MRSPLLLLALVVSAAVAAVPAAPASEPGSAVVVDQPDGFSDPLTGAGGFSSSRSGGQTVSADGRYVVFASSSDGLSNRDDDSVKNLFRKDRSTGAVELVSVATDGTAADEASSNASISDDGTRVAFASTARTLDRSAPPGEQHIFVRDLAAGTTTLVSRADGQSGQPVNAGEPEISGHGKHVVFTTTAKLDGADTNGFSDVYLRDVAAGTTLWVSRGNGPNGGPGARASFEPAVNATGTMVAFTTFSAFDDYDQNGYADVYRRWIGATNTDASTTELISVREADKKAEQASSDQPSISADGYAVAFRSAARGLDSAANDSAYDDVYLRYAGDTMLVSGGGIYGGLATDSGQPDVTGDRQHLRVAFQTYVAATPASGAPRHYQIGVRRMSDMDFEPASVDAAGNLTTGEASVPALARDADVVVFDSVLGELAPGVGGDYSDVAARDLAAGATELVSGGPQGPLAEDLGDANVRGGGRAVSSDGRYAVFEAGHDGLGPADRGAHAYWRDLRTGKTVLIGRYADGSPVRQVWAPAISDDGSTVAFSTGERLLPQDTNDTDDVYVTVVATGETRLVTGAAAGGASNGPSFSPVLDEHGRHVAFASTASNLSETADTNAHSDVFLHDVQAGTTRLISREGVAGDGDAYGPALSADGGRVAFMSSATNQLPEDKDASFDVYVRDLAKGTLALASARTDGTKEDRSSSGPSLSADGRLVAFGSNARLEPAADKDALDDVYVRDLDAGATTLASRGDGAGGADADGDAWAPVISPDGVAVAFESSATNLGAPASTVFVRRLADTSTTPAARGVLGGLTAGGACLVIGTAKHAVVQSSPDYTRVVLQAVRPECEVTTGEPGAGPGTGPGPGDSGGEAPVAAPELTGLGLRRARFRVGRTRTAVTARVRPGTTVRFRLDRAAAVTLTVQRRAHGRWVRKGALRRAGRAGANRVPFSGRIGRTALQPGRYRFVARARDAQGRASASRRARFRVAR